MALDVEPKVKAGAAAGGVTGLVVAALIAVVPAFHNGVPAWVVALIPVALSWAGHVIAAYEAPHATSRDPVPAPAATALPAAGSGGAAGTVRIVPTGETPSPGGPPS